MARKKTRAGAHWPGASVCIWSRSARSICKTTGPVRLFVVVFERLQGHHAKPVTAYSALSQFNNLLRDKACSWVVYQTQAQRCGNALQRERHFTDCLRAQRVDRRERGNGSALILSWFLSRSLYLKIAIHRCIKSAIVNGEKARITAGARAAVKIKCCLLPCGPGGWFSQATAYVP